MASAFDPTLEGRAPAMGSGYSVEHMQTLVSVVTTKERKMLGALIAVGTKARKSFVMGAYHCRRTEST